MSRKSLTKGEIITLGVTILLIIGGLVSAPGLLWPLFPQLAPRPPQIPQTAAAEWSLKGGVTWRWRRALPDGCASWMGKADWGVVTLSSQASGCDAGPRVNYLSGSELVFQGYWPKLGMSGGEVCPHAISPMEIAKLRKVTDQALDRSVTQAEKAVLRRVQDRLANVRGNALTTDAGGWCNDLKPEDYVGRPARAINEWR